jgi:ATP-dependent Lhr-like helicase
LDLGVDFAPVERVLQIGSPKGVARLLQRAGRSGHAPGRPSRVSIVPTHSLEIIEGVAARAAVDAGQIEARPAPQQPLDVLVQHLVTVALGGGFTPDALLAEVRSTAAYADRATKPGAGAWTLWRRAAPRWRLTPITAAWWPTKPACGACPTRGWRGATAPTSAPL